MGVILTKYYCTSIDELYQMSYIVNQSLNDRWCEIECVSDKKGLSINSWLRIEKRIRNTKNVQKMNKN